MRGALAARGFAVTAATDYDSAYRQLLEARFDLLVIDLVETFAGVEFIKRVQGMRIITPKWKSAEVKKKTLVAVPHKTNGHDDALAARTNHMADDPQ